jgi:hypothetical protein
MAKVSDSEYSLGALGESTGWFDNRSATADVGFNITGTFVGTIALEVSNQAATTKTRYSTVTTYSAPTAPLNIPRELGTYWRFVVTAYVSGTAFVGISPTIDANGQVVHLSPQSVVSGRPTGDA